MIITDPKKRSLLFQFFVLAIVFSFGWFLFQNTQANLDKRNISTGFEFLNQEAAFEISETFLVEYSPSDTYLKAFAVGVINTLKVSVIGIILSLLFGTFLGICRLSPNWLLQKISASIIEVLRNTPLLLQLFFWYALFTEALPHPRQALKILPHVFLTNRGMYYPKLNDHPIYFWIGLAILFSIVVSAIFYMWAKRYQDKTGKALPKIGVIFLIFLLPSLLLWATAGFPMTLDVPQLAGFNFKGGRGVTPEFFALLVGLVLFTSAFVAETVRAGILSVDSGQTEAALALGLKPRKILSLIILPQALRVIIPPLTSQMLNLLKNSSLALAIGYPDLVAVANITLNQTGQAIENIALIMAVYLFFSLLTSAFMNWYNKKVALIER